MFPAIRRDLLCVFSFLSVGFVACTGGDDPKEEETVWVCSAEPGSEPDSLATIGCQEDFLLLSSRPTDSSLPGARSVKTIIDRVDSGKLYFQDSNKFQLHYDFASTHLSAVDDLPIIADQAAFNDNYYSEQRRFFLGAVTFYEGPAKWVYEISPYDTASAEMIKEAYSKVLQSAYFGKDLYYHPTGESGISVAKELPPSVKVVTTEELYEGIDYQALNLATSCGKLVFHTSKELESEYISYQDIVVLDSVPNDISVAQGIITADFQTPLSHVNVLSQNRGTPNMALRGAFENEDLRALEGKWVVLQVGAFEYTVTETTKDKIEDCIIVPDPIDITGMDLSVTELTDIEDIYDPESDVPLKTQISESVPAFGGKASHYSPLSRIDEANAPKAFAVPVYFYNQFMDENGFTDRVKELLADEQFLTDAATRDMELLELRTDMMAAPLNDAFTAALFEKLDTEYNGIRMRFRSSTNAEDLGDFTGAGLYTSKSGDPSNPDEPVEDAVREVWSSVWFFRAFEERAYNGIDHMKVGMALLVHESFPDESANGVASTANPYDTSGVEPGFYVNVQAGDESVVQPDTSITTDQFIYYYDMQGQPIVFIEHSSLVAEGATVLSTEQTHSLGVALKAIHQYFYEAYAPKDGAGWYAMDVEFKFNVEVPGEDPVLVVKQARPYPGRSN